MPHAASLDNMFPTSPCARSMMLMAVFASNEWWHLEPYFRFLLIEWLRLVSVGEIVSLDVWWWRCWWGVEQIGWVIGLIVLVRTKGWLASKRPTSFSKNLEVECGSWALDEAVQWPLANQIHTSITQYSIYTVFYSRHTISTHTYIIQQQNEQKWRWLLWEYEHQMVTQKQEEKREKGRLQPHPNEQ